MGSTVQRVSSKMETSKAELTRDTSRNSGAKVSPCVSAAHLPFDILCEIFRLYEEHQYDYKDPRPYLEVLLLVCESWAYVARSTPSLWSRFELKIRREEHLNFWQGRVHRRLRLCGPTCPLDVTVHLRLADHYNLTEDVKKQIEDVIRPVVGLSGEVASRWRDIEFLEENFRQSATNSILAKYLMYPTPLLRSLCLCDVGSVQPLLPFTPSLETFRNSSPPPLFPSITNLSTVKKAEVDTNEALKVLACCACLTHLTLHLDDEFGGTFPHLHHLELVGDINEWISTFAAPHLRSVHVQSLNADGLAILATLPGIPQDKIEEVRICLSPQAIRHPETCREAAQKLLASLRSLKVLELNQDAEGIIIKLIVTDGHNLLRNQPCTIKTSSRTFQMVPEEDRSTLFGRVYSVDPSVFQGRWEDLPDFCRVVVFRQIAGLPHQ